MEQQDSQDHLSPLHDAPSAARERLDYNEAQGTRRRSRKTIIDRASSSSRPDFEPSVSSPLRQPSWDQGSVPSPPRGSPVVSHSYDDGSLADDEEEEPATSPPPGLERASRRGRARRARWYVEPAQSPRAAQRPASPIRLLSESSEPDLRNTSFPFFTPQEPVGSPAGSSAPNARRPRQASPSPVTPVAYDAWSALEPGQVPFEFDVSPEDSDQRPAGPRPGRSSEDAPSRRLRRG
ncbi:uncharacterized protein MAM_07778 [Metarhizium album ARSEF 1941]|uniref:Uncharacterized protein n=1 Tax=Metarhizium album (strain ARSEF 1941) TaxID=1081103 RepID=A0A0B2WL05_METAS|nr:uncharacterized protein MAM_07778 [Metarhizium album ARSEF 1941]KHN94349.1 hypothetical protein MAM_07778 [Metarhizium album ARSEF 1941]